MFTDLTLNWWAVIAGGILQMVTGMIWYNPKTFGQMWMKANGLTTENMNKDKMGQLYFLQFIAALVFSYVLALFVAYIHPIMLKDGLILGFWLWLGFMAAGAAGLYIFPTKPFPLFAMDSLYKLINIFLLIWLFMSWR